ncbi:uncharacterized protein LOC144579823 [Callithrix jacchus]
MESGPRRLSGHDCSRLIGKEEAVSSGFRGCPVARPCLGRLLALPPRRGAGTAGPTQEQVTRQVPRPPPAVPGAEDRPPGPRASSAVRVCEQGNPGVRSGPAAPRGLCLHGVVPLPPQRRGPGLLARSEISADRVICCPRGSGLSTPRTLPGKRPTDEGRASSGCLNPTAASLRRGRPGRRPAGGNAEEVEEERARGAGPCTPRPRPTREALPAKQRAGIPAATSGDLASLLSQGAAGTFCVSTSRTACRFRHNLEEPGAQLCSGCLRPGPGVARTSGEPRGQLRVLGRAEGADARAKS